MGHGDDLPPRARRDADIRYPPPGPYDLRLGFAQLPHFVDRLARAGYEVVAQASSSRALLAAVDAGLYPVYREKPQAGLSILDRHGRDLFTARYPERVYDGFEAIPPVVVETVRYLENRELLNARLPRLNPAVEWDRFGRAAGVQLLRGIAPGVPRMGGSTLATQIEKFRHSPGGRTESLGDKARQIASASVRAYLDGPATLSRQRAVVTDYLNAMPLAALPGHGEVTGLGDGLWAWFDADFERINATLERVNEVAGEDALDEAARAYRQVVTLLVATRRPSDYLLLDTTRLARLTSAQFDGLQRAGVIGAEVARRARTADTPLRSAVVTPRPSLTPRKAATWTRARLATVLDVETLYGLDRLDVSVVSTLDRAVQRAVEVELTRLADPVAAREAGLDGPRLLAGADPGAVVYGLILYERQGDANLLRVRVDNLDQPLDVNGATQLELGSTAKLRTLVTYLEVVAELHADYAGRPADLLTAAMRDHPDPLTRWALGHLTRFPDTGRSTLLELAMERRYPASPAERFRTGDGLHTFQNFDADDDARTLTVREAFQRSVNLVFIRLMRDLTSHHLVRLPGWAPSLLADPGEPQRQLYLHRFAERESAAYLRRLSADYRGLPPAEAFERLVSAGPQSPTRLAVIHRSVYPAAGLPEFTTFLRSRADAPTADEAARRLYETYGRDRASLADRGHLSGHHPLELWLVLDLVERGGRSVAPSALPPDVVRDVYGWLFRTRRIDAQNQRITTELERDAFTAIHRRWARLGYPFARLVPSLATALGSSGDTPAALAELVGILQNGGRRAPRLHLTDLRFAEGTPFETILSASPAGSEAVLHPDVAAVARLELTGVVEHGTGRRIAGAFVDRDGTPLVIGGKTGTGDNRVAGGGGRAGDRILNRTATFTFFIGDRFHGTVTAHVDGPRAADYEFTSGLPVQVLRHLVPTLLPLFE